MNNILLILHIHDTAASNNNNNNNHNNNDDDDNNNDNDGDDNLMKILLFLQITKECKTWYTNLIEGQPNLKVHWETQAPVK